MKSKPKAKAPPQKPIRVVHAPYDVGGNGYFLSRGERANGVAARTVVYFKQVFGYPADKDLKVGAGKSPFKAWRWWLEMGRILLTADVVHFNFGGSFLSDVAAKRVATDLPLLRRLGIRTFLTFQGCDSRISSYSLEHFSTNPCEECRSRPFCAATYNTFKREVIGASARYFDGVWALNPDLLHNIQHGRFLPYSNVDIDDWRPPRTGPGEGDPNRPIRVLHAPTWREIKGTPYILEALEALKAEGENIEIILVENVPHAEVRALYERADLLIDQVKAGWYGGLAVELMALGRPVVAYLREGDLNFLPPDMRKEMPVVSASPSTLKETVRELIRDRPRLTRLGNQSRAFVYHWHHPHNVGRTTTEAYAAAVEAGGGRVGKLRRLKTLWKLGTQRAGEICKLYLSTIRTQAYILAQRSGPKILYGLYWVSQPLMRAREQWRLGIRKTPSVMWGVTPILTLPLLARADRMLGMNATSICYVTYHITKGFDVRLDGHVAFLAKHMSWSLPIYYRLVLLWALHRTDVFHFFYDQGLLERDGRFGLSVEELDYIKRSGKRLYLYAYGADVRTRSETEALGEFSCCTYCPRPMVNCICDSGENAVRMERYKDVATALLSMGDMTVYVPDARNIWYWPIDTAKYPDVRVRRDPNRPLKVLHAPNHAWAKGSDFLFQAVEELRQEGIDIELVRASGVSNERVMQLIAECDVVADQFLIGWHGYTAIEAMARGKVTMAYIRDRSMLLAPDECPLIDTPPREIARVLRELAAMSPAEIEDLGRRGRQYVLRYYSIDAVAGRLMELYEETANFSQEIQDRMRHKLAHGRITN